MTRSLLVLVAGLVLAGPALARNAISGEVRDRNGAPLDRVVITLKPGNVQLVTDREGRFLVDYLRDDEGERAKLAKKTDYAIEIFKPGFHVEKRTFFYKKGELILDPFTMVEETIAVRDDGQNLDPEIYSTGTTNTGATYEGQ
jgi:hypothetical protein